MPTRQSTGLACGRAAGWCWRAYVAVTPSERRASISCRTDFLSARGGIDPGFMAGGAEPTPTPTFLTDRTHNVEKVPVMRHGTYVGAKGMLGLAAELCQRGDPRRSIT